MIRRLAWVTARAARGRDEDEPLALAALRRTGVQVDVVDWDDPVSAVADLVNPAATVRWNLDKHYLIELAGAGVPITPTEFVRGGETATFPAGHFVIKPAVGAGSRDAASYRPDQHAQARAH